MKKIILLLSIVTFIIQVSTLLGGVCNSARSIIENLKYQNLYYAIYAAHTNNFIPVTINGQAVA